MCVSERESRGFCFSSRNAVYIRVRIRLEEGATGNTGARSARGPDPIAENVNTLVTRLCTITGRARKQTRANAYAPRASLYAPALKVAILNSLSNDTERQEEKEQKT